jgi:hypothetical protein
MNWHNYEPGARAVYAMMFAGNWCGGWRTPEQVSAEQQSGGNGPNPDWASAEPRRSRPSAPARTKRPRKPRFKLDDITREEPPSMRRIPTVRPAAA